MKDSPQIDIDRPVSRQMETGVYDYYGWSPYWSSGYYMSGYMGSRIASPYRGTRRREQVIAEAQAADHFGVRLRSVEAGTGYHIQARDGEIGHVEDFLVDDADWSIHHLVVDTKNWWTGKQILVSSRSAGEIDWKHRLREAMRVGGLVPPMGEDGGAARDFATYCGIKFTTWEPYFGPRTVSLFYIRTTLNPVRRPGTRLVAPTRGGKAGRVIPYR